MKGREICPDMGRALMRIREANVLPETDKRKLGKEMDTNMRKLGEIGRASCRERV